MFLTQNPTLWYFKKIKIEINRWSALKHNAVDFVISRVESDEKIL